MISAWLDPMIAFVFSLIVLVIIGSIVRSIVVSSKPSARKKQA